MHNLKIKKNKIEELLIADKQIDQYYSIIHKTFKTQLDKNIIIAKYIRDVFGLNSFNKLFLMDLGKLNNIDKFYKSLIYLANDDYKNKFIEKYKNKEFKLILSNVFKQAKLIEQLLKIFWKDGLLDTNTIKIYSEKNKYTDEEKIFINNNEKELRIQFQMLKRKVQPKNSFQLVDWVDTILREFFGGFIFLNQSERKQQKINKKRFKYYDFTINQQKYLELVINKNKNIISNPNLMIIKNNFLSKKCIYASLNLNIIMNDLINYTKLHYSDYMFVEYDNLLNNINFDEDK